ncbi:MAG: rhamnogalacturonan acetylesterase [Siphonobacter sp.]
MEPLWTVNGLTVISVYNSRNYFTMIRILIACLVITQATYAQKYKFDFGAGPVASGYLKVEPTTRYDSVKGYGFLPGSSIQGFYAVRKIRDYCTSSLPFFFAVDLPEGNYDVELLLGDEQGASVTTVKAESRRLMAEHIQTPVRKVIKKIFTVNIRTPHISSTERVKLKPREVNSFTWDNRLTFEFLDEVPKIAALEIRPNQKATTIFLAGNSTVVDQANEPFAAWGQMIPAFFKPHTIAVANHAESGESLRSFLAEKRLAKIMKSIRPGDYFFIEFAHNDQKQSDLRPFVEYKALLKTFIDSARTKGAYPVLVTSMHRRRFDESGHIINTLGDFPEAMRQTAGEQQVPLIDLNAMSKTLWEALGPAQSRKAFIHYPAGSFPGQNEELNDDTHFSNYGAYLLALCVTKGLREAVPVLAKELQDNLPAFDPAYPVLPEQWKFPVSSRASIHKPEGN